MSTLVAVTNNYPALVDILSRAHPNDTIALLWSSKAIAHKVLDAIEKNPALTRQIFKRLHIMVMHDASNQVELDNLQANFSRLIALKNFRRELLSLTTHGWGKTMNYFGHHLTELPNIFGSWAAYNAAHHFQEAHQHIDEQFSSGVLVNHSEVLCAGPAACIITTSKDLMHAQLDNQQLGSFILNHSADLGVFALKLGLFKVAPALSYLFTAKKLVEAALCYSDVCTMQAIANQHQESAWRFTALICTNPRLACKVANSLEGQYWLKSNHKVVKDMD